MNISGTMGPTCIWLMVASLFMGCSNPVGDGEDPDGGAGDAPSDSEGGGDGDTGGDSDGDADIGGAVDTEHLSPGKAAFGVAVKRASDIRPEAPGTVGIVTWSVDVAPLEGAHIELGLDETYGMIAPVDLEEPGHRTLLLGMKPGRTYHFRIVAHDGTNLYTSDDYTVDTGPETDLVSVNEFHIIDDNAREPGFIVVSYWQGDGSRVAFIIDGDGEIVWWHRFDLDRGDSGICRARMSADGRHMWMAVSSNAGGRVRSVTMDGLDEVAYDDTVGSHDITPVRGSTMAYLDYGENDCNSIFEIDPGGVPVEVFEGEGIIDTEGGIIGGGCHGNALRYSAAEDLYTYSDVSSDIYMIHRATGELDRRLTDIVGSNEDWGESNHGHHLLDNSFLIFGNRGGEENVSIVKEYTLDGEEILAYDSGRAAQNLGDVQRLPGGNTLVSYSNAQSYVHEIDPQGNRVLEIDLGAGGPALGYVLWRDSLYGPPPDIDL